MQKPSYPTIVGVLEESLIRDVCPSRRNPRPLSTQVDAHNRRHRGPGIIHVGGAAESEGKGEKARGGLRGSGDVEGSKVGRTDPGVRGGASSASCHHGKEGHVSPSNPR
ncbi:hypothetical protein KM043_006346 [Ampulex compressa]|nr:hypothetical protein KM043_006346 [Ampulex compressa]